MSIFLYIDLGVLQHIEVYSKSQTNNTKILIHEDYIGCLKYKLKDTNYLSKNILNGK